MMQPVPIEREPDDQCREVERPGIGLSLVSPMNEFMKTNVDREAQAEAREKKKDRTLAQGRPECQSEETELEEREDVEEHIPFTHEVFQMPEGDLL